MVYHYLCAREAGEYKNVCMYACLLSQIQSTILARFESAKLLCNISPSVYTLHNAQQLSLTAICCHILSNYC